MTRFTAMLITFLLLTGAAACGSGDDQGVVADGGDDGAPPAGEPGGRDDGLFVSVEQGGGFMLVGHDFRSVPNAVVYEDGTTLSPGAVIEVFPGPAVHPVIEGETGQEQMEAIVEAAAEAGLLGDTDPDFGDPPIADAATTTITIVVDGETHVTSVYALMEADQTLPGMESEQNEARQRVSAFVDLVSSTVVTGEGEQYVPERYRVLPLAPEARPQPDEGIQPDEREWPFPDVPLRERECVAVTGDRAATFREALDDATEITRWRTASGETFVLVVRPVLPHEPDCPEGS